MQLSAIKEQFPRVEQSIARADEVCRSDASAPQALKDCVRELDSQRKQAHHLVSTSQDQEGIRECINEMEQTSDRAKAACRDGSVSDKLKQAVMEAHAGLSNLKQQAN
jgi:hypothetical protein